MSIKFFFFTIKRRSHEVCIDCFGGHTQVVTSLECVVAVVVVGGVFEDEAALQRVSVNVGRHADVFGLRQLGVFVEEAHLGQRLASDDKHHARVVPFLWFFKAYDGRRDCRRDTERWSV